MCGNYALTQDGRVLKVSLRRYLGELKILGLEDSMAWQPQYLTRPSNRLPVVKQREKNQAELRFDLMEWGLKAPDWKTGKIRPLINAKGETVARLPSFRTPFKKTRCLAFADGFYEPDRDTRQPWYIRFKDQRLFAFASLYSPPLHDEKADRVYPEAWALTTTEPNGLVGGPVNHHRMPVILTDPGAMELWLDPKAEPEKLKDLLRPHPEKEMEAWKVDRSMYKKGGEDPSVLEPQK